MAGDVGDNLFAGTQLRRRGDGHELEMNGKVSRFEEGKRREASKSNAILAKTGGAWGITAPFCLVFPSRGQMGVQKGGHL
jgi:hypothetical protein